MICFVSYNFVPHINLLGLKIDFSVDHIASGTGYGYPSYGPPIHGPPLPPHDFTPTIHEQHIYLPGHDDEEEYHHAPVYHSKGKGHDLSIKDFFEIALTALAFLAFGLFVIQLLMSITVRIIFSLQMFCLKSYMQPFLCLCKYV